MTIDPADNPVIVGSSTTYSPTNSKLLTVSFSPDGNVRWAARYENAVLRMPAPVSTRGNRIAVNVAGETFVAAKVYGLNGPSTSDLLVVKYNPQGQELWAQRFNEGLLSNSDTKGPIAMAPSAAGGVYVSGSTYFGTSTFTVKFDALGNPVWFDDEYECFNRAIVTNPLDDGVYVAGDAPGNPSGADLAILRYAPDGLRIFTNRYNRAGQSDDRFSGFDVDAQGRAYIGGTSTNAGGPTQPHGLWGLQILPDGGVGWGAFHENASASAFVLDAFGHATFIATASNDGYILQFDDTGSPRWERRLNTIVGSVDDRVYGTAVAQSGDVFVLGKSDQRTGSGRIVTVKYNALGVEQWRRRIADGIWPSTIALDPGDNPIIIGTTGLSNDNSTRDIAIVKYASDGSVIWRTNYDGGNEDSPQALAVDSAGLVYVSGSSAQSGYHYFLMSLTADGVIRWIAPTDAIGIGYHVAVDVQNAVFVASVPFAVEKFHSNGDLEWVRSFANPNSCQAGMNTMALDHNGDVVIVGRTCIASTRTCMGVVKFSSAGDFLWSAETDGGVAGSLAEGMALDAEGNGFAVGHDQIGVNGPVRWQTAHFSSQGERRWVVPYPGVALSEAVVDPAGYVYVAGSPNTEVGGADLVVLRYDFEGNLRWRACYGFVEQGADQLNALAIDSSRRIYISGRSDGIQTGPDLATLRFSSAPLPCQNGDTCYLGDTDGDCRVGLSDLTAVLSHFGSSAGDISPADGDLNFDGVVNLTDLLAILHTFGADCR